MTATRFLIVLLGVVVIATALEAQIDRGPYTDQESQLIGDSIHVGLGDTVFVVCDRNGNSLKNFRILDSMSASTGAIMIGLTLEDFGGKDATILRVFNPFDQVLRYRANTRLKGRARFTETTIVPVYPKIPSMEMWPYEIASVILYEFTISEK